MSGVDYLFVLGYVVSEFLNVLLCYYLIFGVEINKTKRNWYIALGLITGIHLCLPLFFDVLQTTYFTIVTMSVIPLLLLKGPKSVRYGLYLFIVLGMSSMSVTCSFLISLVMDITEGDIFSSYPLTLICQAIPFFLLFIVFTFRKIKGRGRQRVFLGKSTYILFYFGLSCVFLILASYQELCKYDLNSNISIVCGVATSVSCVIFLFMILWHGIAMNRELELREQINRIAEYNRMREEYFDQLITQDDKIRRFRHDMKAHLAAINGYVKDGRIEEIENYLKKISEDSMLHSAKIYSGDKGADAILSSLCDQAAGKNIDITINGSLTISQGISSFELCSIFYNLTQNAIEACEKLPDAITKEICINMAQVNNHGIISVENPVAEKVKITDGKIETQKTDRHNHGIGLRNVTDIVKKHDGTIKFSCDDRLFKVELVL